MSEIADQWEGSPLPLGVTWQDAAQAYNFALYAKDAERVTLLLYGAADATVPLATIPLEFPANKTNRVWHARVRAETAGDARYYAYRIEGPVDPAQGLRYDAAKILLDPYARGVHFPPGHSRAAACLPGPNDGRAPLGVLPSRSSSPSAPRVPRPPRHDHDLVIYEMHVRGFTRSASSRVDPSARGTFAGIVAKIPHLKELGVTAVELLPVHQFDPDEGNYWGYMTLNFFSPHLLYASARSDGSPAEEFRAMVDALHAAGIEVILDVVYNHTTEMGHDGPTYSLRGIDNTVYYALDAGDPSTYTNHSGCGNDLRTAHPVVRHLVVDSLRYWALEMGVDGFRFDLASIFLRNEDGSLNLDDPPIISEISADPDLAGMRLIAEPWSGDGSGYVMGRSFPGCAWSQWNDRFRDTVRRFVKGDPGLVADVATRLYGSTDVFPDDLLAAYRRWQSVNFFDSHDGFNLCDLVSYTNDGQNSWDCGAPGTADVPSPVAELRQRQARNFCALLMLANGSPMFVAGDEFLHTQRGNPNPWNQDNETTWLDWSMATSHADLLRFFRGMIALRKAHPAVGRGRGWREEVTWFGVEGALDTGPSSRALAYHLDGRPASDCNLYVLINMESNPREFRIQVPGPWWRAVDTALLPPAEISEPGSEPAWDGGTYPVGARSVVVLVSERGTTPPH
jgi:glycogen operon protein